MTHRPHQSVIDNAPLAGVCAGLLLAAIPLIPHVAPWAIALFVGALLSRLLVNHFHLELPPLAAKVTVLALGLAGIGFSYGSLLGIEPGLGILLILISLKLLETNTVRDFQVLTLLGWFLSLCGLFFSQSFATWLYIAAISALLTASLVRFHRGAAPRSFRSSARLALTLILQAAPIVVVLFLFFPRNAGPFRFSLSQMQQNVSGMSDEIEPGSVAALAMSDEVAFRAEFPDGDAPALPHLYWRGGVMWRGNGLSWSRGSPYTTESLAGRLEGPRIRQKILLEPHGGRWLFALDRPEGALNGAQLVAGGYLQLEKSLRNGRRHIDVISRPENREVKLLDEQRLAALQRPEKISPRIQALVDSWRETARSPREIVDLALRFFRNGRFSYTLEPGTYRESTALDDFLFQRRAGFCEHYAAAFATLMRVAGIPARLVTGYHGGEYNRSYVIVRQSESHVWCEVWLRDIGWKRIDPTDVIAPERINSGLESYLESRAAADQRGRAESSTMIAGLRELVRDVRLTWDSLSYQWDLRVLNFDEDSQRSFFAVIGLQRLDWDALLGLNVLGAAAILSFFAFFLGRPPAPSRDPIVRYYQRFCRILASAGVSREPWEGPLAFSERAARALPEHASVIEKITRLYIGQRYAKSAANNVELARAVNALGRRWSHPKKTADPREELSHHST